MIVFGTSVLAQDDDLAQGMRHYKRGKALLAKKSPAAARAEFAKALALFGDEHPVRAAWMHGWFGNCSMQQGEFVDAAEEWTRCLERMRKHKGPRHPYVARSLQRIANCHVHRKRHEQALPFFEQSLAIYRSAYEEGNVETANCLWEYADANTVLRRFDTAVSALREILAMYRHLHEGDHEDVASGHGQLGYLLCQIDRGADALPHFQDALAMRRRLYEGDHRLVVSGLNNLAYGHLLMGHAWKALPLYEAALAMQRRLGGDIAIASALRPVGQCLTHLGRHAEALECYREALETSQRVHKGDHIAVARSLNEMAMWYWHAGRYAEALPIYAQALAMQRRLVEGDDELLAFGLNNMAACLDRLGRYEEGLPYHEQTLAMRRRLHEGDHRYLAQALSNMGMGLSGLGRRREALSYFRQAVEMARRVDAVERHIWVTLWADCHLDLEEPEPAVPLLEEAIRQIEDYRNAATALTEGDRAAFFRQLKDFDAYDQMVRAQRMRGRDAAALSYLEQARARSLLDMLERSRVDPVAQMRAQADEAQLARIDAIDSEFRKADAAVARLNHRLATERTRALKKELAEASRRREEVLRQHAQLVRDHVQAATPADAGALRRLAGRDGCVLIYSVTEEGTILFHVGAAIRSYSLAITAKELDRKIDRYSEWILAKQGLADSATSGHELFRALVPDAVWKDVVRARVAYVVADGALNRLAFETLVVDPRKKTYWLDAGPPLAYGASGSALLWSRQRRDEQGEQPRLPAFVAVGDPAFRKGGRAILRYGPLTRLPGTRREVETIAGRLKDLEAVTLVGQEATRSNLRRAAPRARYLHIATHGIGDETSNASHSSLALTPPPRPTPEDDGFLKLSDLFARWRGTLRGCELVVLSACETQTGRAQKDEAVMALPIGFLFAGTPSVVASLWRVEDKSTADLMAKFYEHLAQGAGKLEAFTKARKFMRGRRPEPYYWAPFIYIGDPR